MASSLTDNELLALKGYSRQVDRLRQCSIVKQNGVNLSIRTSINLFSGEATHSFSGYDTESFQAALPILRQFMLKDEINFNRIHNIINQRCDRQKLLDWSRYAKRNWDEILDTLPDLVHRHFHVSAPTVEGALRKVFYGYGGLFHVDIHAPREVEGMRAIEHGMLHRAFPKLFWCLHVIDSVIYLWIDKPTEPVPAVPTN
jgi:hypothetical protein